MLNFDRNSTVKHGTQNIRNDCHQWLSGSFRVRRIRFGRGSAPGPTRRAYSALPDPLVGLRDPTTKRERGGREKEREINRVEKENGREIANSWIRPLLMRRCLWFLLFFLYAYNSLLSVCQYTTVLSQNSMMYGTYNTDRHTGIHHSYDTHMQPREYSLETSHTSPRQPAV